MSHKTGEDEPPPFLGTWPRVYLMVGGYLVSAIAVLWVLSQAWR